MSNPVERRPGRDPRRGLQSVVELYLSRPPRRGPETAPPEEGLEASASGGIGADPQAGAPGEAASSSVFAPSTPPTEPPRAEFFSRARIEPGFMRPYVGWDEGSGDEPAPSIEGAGKRVARKGRHGVAAPAPVIPGGAVHDPEMPDPALQIAKTPDAETPDAASRFAKTSDVGTRDAASRFATTPDPEIQDAASQISKTPDAASGHGALRIVKTPDAETPDAASRFANTFDAETLDAPTLSGSVPRAAQDDARAEAESKAFFEPADADLDDDGFEGHEAPEPVLSGISLDAEDFDAPASDPRGDDLLAEIVEDALPAQEIGAEALRAELAFKLEEHWGIGDDPDDDARATGASHGPQATTAGPAALATRAADEALATDAFVEASPVPDASPSATGEWPAPEVRVEEPARAADEIEVFFEEDAGATGVVAMRDGLAQDEPGTSIAEIFDMVDRSLALGPGAVIDVAPIDPAASLLLEDAASIEAAGETVRSPRVVLFLSTLPPRLRRRLLDSLAAPVVTLGRRALFLESDTADDETGGLIEEALGLDSAVWRRSLGASPREILLMRPAQRAQLFAGLAAEERRSELVLVGVGLPESIFCPRLLHLVDTVVVGLSPQESSLYEAYRALRGVPERRPGITPYVVTLASSAEEAEMLFERFRGIASDFLRMPILDGGWLELTARPQDSRAAARTAGAQGPRPGIAPELLELLTREMGSRGFQAADAADAADAIEAQGAEGAESVDGSIDWPEAAVPEVPRAFFERLADWFGPAAR